jgi:hypothetical protein
MRPLASFRFSPEKLRTERAGRGGFLGAEIASAQVSRFSSFFVCSQGCDLLFFAVLRRSQRNLRLVFQFAAALRGLRTKNCRGA